MIYHKVQTIYSCYSIQRHTIGSFSVITDFLVVVIVKWPQKLLYTRKLCYMQNSAKTTKPLDTEASLV